MTNTPIDFIALSAARDIDDAFADGYAGGATQRTARVQCIVAAAIMSAFEQATSGLIASAAKTKAAQARLDSKE